MSTQKHAQKPPIIHPGAGNNIVVNPCQVAISIESDCLRSFDPHPANESSASMHSECGQRVWRHCLWLSSGANDWDTILEVRLFTIYFSKILPSLISSLKYHRLHPEYIHQRIARLGHAYNLRILLVVCDVVRSSSAFILYQRVFHVSQTEHQDSIREITKVKSPVLDKTPR